MAKRNVVQGRLLDCGKHFTVDPNKPAGAPCSKCQHNRKLAANVNYRNGLQYNGTPWLAIFEPPTNTES